MFIGLLWVINRVIICWATKLNGTGVTITYTLPISFTAANSYVGLIANKSSGDSYDIGVVTRTTSTIKCHVFSADRVGGYICVGY